MKKKILIANNNLKLGGIQKALVNLLNEIADEFEITLLLFRKVGEFINEVPNNIKVIELDSDYKFLGLSQNDCKFYREKLKRGKYVLMTRLFKFKKVIKRIEKTEKNILGPFDIAIAYQHAANQKVFYGGVGEFVLQHVVANQKIIFIHCDYISSGTNSAYNNAVYKKFDKIACVSDSVKKAFLQILPEMKGKVFTVYNCINYKEILKKSAINKFFYDSQYINILTVARLSKEKGLERAIEALQECKRKDLRYYIIGDGKEKNNIVKLIKKCKLTDMVYLMGADQNPYRYMTDFEKSYQTIRTFLKGCRAAISNEVISKNLRNCLLNEVKYIFFSEIKI